MGLRILNNRTVRYYMDDEIFGLSIKVFAFCIVLLSAADVWHEGWLGFFQTMGVLSLILTGIGFLGSVVTLVVRGFELKNLRRWERN